MFYSIILTSIEPCPCLQMADVKSAPAGLNVAQPKARIRIGTELVWYFHEQLPPAFPGCWWIVSDTDFRWIMQTNRGGRIVEVNVSFNK